ncbi:NAD-dependent succinate-semialdehyde dehydrogenase [Rhodococcus sovatensis]|uniref:NAD-dependent succinate-semialdehyde dehydrogenase n=1 Tax=Rhodococcus sovatensis TaxID=1805840 RepID=A0ABZ2PLM9_9NOCA
MNSTMGEPMPGYATTDPTTCTRILEFRLHSDGEVDSRVRKAQAAYRRSTESDVTERAASLIRTARLYRKNAERLAALSVLEIGKPVSQAMAEVELAASIYEYYGTAGPAMLADEPVTAEEGRAIIRTAPIGVVLGVMPWNLPYYQAARFVAPNLLLGNSVLLKHAECCPQQALEIAILLRDAGLPSGRFTNLFLSHRQVADLVADPLVRGVSLTGSERAGVAIGELAGKHVKKAVLELGGSDPFIVLPSADLTLAVDVGTAGRFGNAGQTCTSAKRIIVHEDIWDEFLLSFVDKAASWTTGDPADPRTRLGPMASRSARNALEDQVGDAIGKGATVHLGGVVPDGPGSFYPATVMSDVTAGMRAYREELFGPVAVLYRARSTEHAIEIANDTPYGLGGAVFTTDEHEAAFVADKLDVGMVGINKMIKSAPALPFGGVKNSGIGRELGRFGVDEFSNKKLIHNASHATDRIGSAHT